MLNKQLLISMANDFNFNLKVTAPFFLFRLLIIFQNVSTANLAAVQ